MERSLWILLVLIGTLSIIHIVQAQGQQGFISLDCGLSPNEVSPYNELETGLQFVSDQKFIKSGNISRVQPDEERNFLKPYTTLRYFPEGIRNCYSLSVEKGRTHLIVARFGYGNYDGLGINPNFDLYLGPNPWTTVDMQRQGNSTREEIIHITTSNTLQVCLVKTGTTIPIISALEIRPLGNESYSTKSGSLKPFFRNYHSNSRFYIRYPNDVYDRQWFAFKQTEWTLISTSLEVDNDNDYDPPKDALVSAAIPSNASLSLTIEWSSANPDDEYYLYAHFAEIEDLETNDTREFSMSLDGEVISDAIIPQRLQITTVVNSSPMKCKEGKCSFQLIRTSRSTLPPLLNALEAYRVIQLPQTETNENDVVAIKNIEATYGLSKINWQGDPCVPLQFRWDGLNCSSTDMSTPPRITTLNLSSSGLSGPIAAAIQNLTQLEKLDLSNNRLTGEIPEFLGNMNTLILINLRGNNLNGSIPQALQRKGLELLVGPSPSGSSPKPKKFPVTIVASVCSVAIFIAVLVVFLVLRKRKPKVPSIKMKKRRFTYSEVTEMTNNFQRVVGKGGFGAVYHGTLNGSKEVAVKILSESSTQGYKEFKAEVELLLRVHHTNLVTLVGYCEEGNHLALIYEFVPNGDLKQHLSGKQGRSTMNWGVRLQIAVEAALGLDYLHTGCEPPIVHRDVKSTNILLEEDCKAKIADFGLSRSVPVGGESQISSKIGGTPGYLDPECYKTNQLGEKSDVYSFGIVLLEIITNQPVIDQTRNNTHITQWVIPKFEIGDISSIMDPNLNGNYETRSAWRALELAMSCANPCYADRPHMSQVVTGLKECLVSENSNSESFPSSAEPTIMFDTGMFPKPR